MPNKIKAEILKKGGSYTLYLWGSGGPGAWFGRKAYRGITPKEILAEIGSVLSDDGLVVLTAQEYKKLTAKKKGGKHGKGKTKAGLEVD